MRHFLKARFVLVGAVVGLLTGSFVMANAAAAQTPSFGHVFVIVGENKSLSQLKSSNAPYIINTLKPRSAWFTNYHKVVSSSLPNYIALTSGQYAQCQLGSPCAGVQNIFGELGAGGWKDWNESMPSNCYKKKAGADATLNLYAGGHNPALWYTGLPCATNDVPAGTTGPNNMNAFNNALAAGNVPKYNFIAPNYCEDSHDACNGANIVTEYNNFLQKEIPLIEASPAFGSNGVIFATYDEGASNTMMAVVGPQVTPGSYAGSYDHYSTLATIEQGLGVGCTNLACTAKPLPLG